VFWQCHSNEPWCVAHCSNWERPCRTSSQVRLCVICVSWWQVVWNRTSLILSLSSKPPLFFHCKRDLLLLPGKILSSLWMVCLAVHDESRLASQQRYRSFHRWLLVTVVCHVFWQSSFKLRGYPSLLCRPCHAMFPKWTICWATASDDAIIVWWLIVAIAGMLPGQRRRFNQWGVIIILYVYMENPPQDDALPILQHRSRYKNKYQKEWRISRGWIQKETC